MSNRTEVNLEFIFACSPSMLHNFLTTSEGLKAWFCEDVEISEEQYAFSWEGETEKALMTENHAKTNIQFDWIGRDSPERTRFEIIRSPITRETILKVKTTCDEALREEEEIYWNNIVEELKHATGG